MVTWAITSGVMEFIAAHPGLLIGGILLYVFIYVLSILFSAPKPGPNPFMRDKARPPEKLVTNAEQRNRVLKQGFLPKKIPENPDVIVIGSGMGGLTVANILARVGKRVLVLEQHDQAGGCCHTFEEKGFEFDVGIHYIGEMRNNTIGRLFINQMTEGQLQWVDLDDQQDTVALGEPGKAKLIPIMSSREQTRKALVDKFPEEEKAVDKFLSLLGEQRKSLFGFIMLKVMNKWVCKILILTGLIHRMTNYFSFSKRSLQEVLDELTDNKDLKAVLAYSFGDYGTIPGEGSFAMHAALLNHYLYGSSYPRGGASEFAFHMIPPIENAGGRVLVRAPVSKILTSDKGRAIGVRVHRSSGDIDIFAPLIVSSAGLINTFKKLLPKEVAEKSSINRLLGGRVKSGAGCMSLFVGLRGNKEELGLEAQNMWAFTGNDVNALTLQYLEQTAEQAMESEVPLLFISFPSAKDPTYDERYPGKSACTVITLANWKWFEQWKDERVMKRGDDYEAIKNAIGQRMWEQVLGHYPQLADKVEYFQVGTPLSNNYYIAAPKGETYGLDHTKTRFGSPEVVITLRPETDIPGLLVSGQDIFSCGFMGATFSGLLCASKILNRSILDDLVKLKKDIAKKKKVPTATLR